jgi:hypothetical protein
VGDLGPAFESTGICRMLWLVLLEVARIILSGEPSNGRRVSSLCEASPYRGNQCILLLMAHRRERECVATAARKRDFVYTVKACELITHIKRFKGTKTLIKDFGMIAHILGDRMGCFLFQLPPSYHFTKARLTAIVSQLGPARRNVVEFRHVSWWNETVYAAFRRSGIIFCSCSGPRLPDELVRTTERSICGCTVRSIGIGIIIQKES